ncbi:MAG: hypothetical protein OXF06_06670 [Bacteroidetes bacterium]|nr:hypothetical protein [Bacteroidota bacterium]
MVFSLPSFAQDPFSELGLRLHATQNVRHNLSKDQWNLARGVKLSLGTPFYVGEWDVTIGIHRFHSSGRVPGFGAIWISSAWHPKISVSPRITLKPTIGIGNYRMSFDDAVSSFSGESSESDFVSNLGVMISFDISQQWFLFSEAEYLRVQTQPLMHLWFCSVGIGFRWKASEFIKTILD